MSNTPAFDKQKAEREISWLGARLREPSTYAGIAVVLAALHFGNAGDWVSAITSIGTGIGGSSPSCCRRRTGRAAITAVLSAAPWCCCCYALPPWLLSARRPRWQQPSPWFTGRRWWQVPSHP